MLHLAQQTDEWLEFRKKMIGASEAPIIMKSSPFKTPYKLWLEKLDIVPAPPKSIAMARGLQLEPQARVKFTEITGIEVEPQVVVNPLIKWMMASMDGISELGHKAVEIKCPGKKDHHTASLGKVPDKYYAQLQHQIEVCGLDMIYYFSFDTDSHYLIEVKRDNNYIKLMLQKEEEFWECLQTFVAP